MPVIPEHRIKISRARIAFIYVLCAVWSAFGPIENYFRTGVVEQSQLVVSLLTFTTAIVVVSITLLLLVKYNRTLKSKEERVREGH